MIAMSCLVLALVTTATSEGYVDFTDMGNYDHGVQQNVRKMSQYGMVADSIPSTELDRSHPYPSASLRSSPESCVRSMEYLQRIVKSLLRQMNVHSHEFGPGEALTIDLQAELKYDDYVVLTKFMNGKQDISDQFLDRVDSITSNFIHVVDHSSSRFQFVERIFNFSALYNLKFWVVLGTSVVIVSLMMILLMKAFNTRAVHLQLIYGFLAIFIVSCVWSFSSLYEDKKAEMMAYMEQHSSVLPKDCDYQNWSSLDSVWYWVRVQFFKHKDRCSEYYTKAMGDPFWKVNPMEAVSSSVAFFFFHPLGYIGEKLGTFYLGFIQDAPFIYKPILLAVAILITVLVFYGPFRISSPFLTIEPVWRPVSNGNVPAVDLDRSPQQVHGAGAVGQGRARNEIMERSEAKSLRDTCTDMHDFLEYLAGGGVGRVDELEMGAISGDSTNRNGKSGNVIVTRILPPPRIEKVDEARQKTECPSTASENVTGDTQMTEEPLELTVRRPELKLYRKKCYSRDSANCSIETREEK